MPLFPMALATVCAFNAGLALRVLVGGHDRIGVGRTLQAGLLLAILTPVEIVLLAPLGLSGFGALNVLWCQLVGVLPVCAAAIWIRRFSGGEVTPGARMLALAALLPVGLWVHCRWIEPFDLRFEPVYVELDPARAGDEPVRIGLLADLQTDRVGEHERAAVALLMDSRPDLILVAGDLFHGTEAGFERELPALRSVLRELSAPDGVWVVLGDADRPEWIERMIAGSAARFLRGEQVEIRVADRRVTLLGIDSADSAAAAIEDLERAPGTDDIRILLAHRPRAVLGLSVNSRIDLVVAGHTHGGQVRIPWVGPPIDLSPLPSTVTGGGLHELEGRRVYISRGVGMERGQAPRLRFRCPPEVTLLTLD